MCLQFFQEAISPWKKGSGGPKFLDFSKFNINFLKMKKKLVFTVFWDDQGAGTLCPPPLHSSFIQKPLTIRVKGRC